ncbi:MAG: hypothetical protein ABIG67_06235, partial [Pseudomonadota bacterium]
HMKSRKDLFELGDLAIISGRQNKRDFRHTFYPFKNTRSIVAEYSRWVLSYSYFTKTQCRPMAATKFEYRNPKLEIHQPEAGKNSKLKRRISEYSKQFPIPWFWSFGFG